MGFEGGINRQFFVAVLLIVMCAQRVSRYPEQVQARCERHSHGYLELDETTKNKSHVSVVSRLERLHEYIMVALREVVRGKAFMWDGCVEWWCVVCGG